MMRLIRWVRVRMTVRQWAWIQAFLALGLGWGHAIVLQPPVSYDEVVDLTLVFRMGVLTAIGSFVAVIGMLMTRSLIQNRQHKGLWIELVGTVLMAGGPLQYFSIQIGFLIAGDFDNRYALVWFAYAMLSFMGVRFAILIPAIIAAGKKADMQRRKLR